MGQLRAGDATESEVGTTLLLEPKLSNYVYVLNGHSTHFVRLHEIMECRDLMPVLSYSR